MSPYPSLDEIAQRLSLLGRLEIYGRSVEGRDLLSVEIGSEGPLVMVTAGIHGLELIGVATALEVASRGPLAGARLLVCPTLNPDGYAATVSGRRQRSNASGVDLNRNFPMPYRARPSALSVLGAGSLRPGDATYRGAAPLSEPETRALADLVAQKRPVASANLHSFLGTLFCARVWSWADWSGYRRLCRAFRAGQGSETRYLRVGTPIGDVFTGELEDWQHHVMGCWAVCVECFSLAESLRQNLRPKDIFWRFNPRDPAPIIARDASGVRAMLAEAISMERPQVRAESADVLDAW